VTLQVIEELIGGQLHPGNEGGFVEVEFGGVVSTRDTELFVAYTEEPEEARDYSLIVGEILSASDRRGVANIGVAKDTAHLRETLGGESGVIHGDRVLSAVEVERELGVSSGGATGERAAHHRAHVLARAFAEGANGTFQLHFAGDDVVAVAAVNGPDAEDHAFVGIDAAATDGLELCDALGSDGDRVNAEMGRGGVDLLTADGNGERVGGGHRRTRGILNDAGIGEAPGVQPEDGGGAGILQRAFLNHEFGAALFAARSAFLGWLEYEFDGTLDEVPVG
jgi:hypothetical protein